MYETIGPYRPVGLGYLERKKNESESSGWQSEIAVFEKAGDCPSPLSAHTSYTAVGAALSQLLNPLVFRVCLKAHSDDARL